jgi:hypothetical protein
LLSDFMNDELVFNFAFPDTLDLYSNLSYQPKIVIDPNIRIDFDPDKKNRRNG